MARPVKPIPQLLYRIRRMVLRLTGWRTYGVKVMLFNGKGELLLIRNSYGKTHLFVLPGGGIHRGEAPEAAAARELREEAGIEADQLAPFATYANTSNGKRDTIHLFTARSTATPVADGWEVEEARFFPIDALPETISAATLRRVAEYRGEQPVSPRW
jgi:8-oxo-dGTP pyrophosphatase MutT (NUDIX family)